MSFDLHHIWASMGTLGKGVAAVLLLMAMSIVAVAVERWITLFRSQRESRKFAAKAAPLIERSALVELVQLAEAHQASALARLFGAVTNRYLAAQDRTTSTGEVTPVSLARNEAERKKEAVSSDLRRGLSVLASIGSVAPFVGLLGTVIGIIGAFQGIAQTGSGGLGAVSSGISEALIETAFGLIVAIPAVLLFNYLSTKINAIELALASSSGELLDELATHYDSRPLQSRRAA